MLTSFFKPRASTVQMLGISALCIAMAPGCGDDADGGGDTDGTGGSSSTGGDAGPGTSNVDTTGGAEESGSTAAAEESGSTAAAEESGSTAADDPEGTSTGGDPMGLCIGFNVVASTNTVAGLDGNNPGGSCEAEPAPCGGDLVGEWEVFNTCGQEDIPNPIDCKASDFAAEVLEISGSMTFNDDGTFSQSVMTSNSIELTVDTMECLGINCAAYEAQLQGDDPMWMCELNEPDCECTLMSTVTNEGSGTWEADGNDVTLSADGFDQTLEYCAMDERLDLWQPVVDPTITETPCADATECEAALGNKYDQYVCTAG